MTLDNVVAALERLNDTCTFIGAILSAFLILYCVLKWSKL